MKTGEKLKRCLGLFKTMYVLSSCTFGGGFVIISMMQKEFVEKKNWLTEEEMLDMTAIAQCAPGSLVVNASVVVGYRLAGIAGALSASLGAVLPPLIIISAISLIYNWFSENLYVAIALQVMRAGVAAIIFDIVITLAGNICKTKNALWICLMILAFLANWFLHVSVILMILVCGVIGLMYGHWNKETEV